jgi:hypothetical protein
MFPLGSNLGELVIAQSANNPSGLVAALEQRLRTIMDSAQAVMNSIGGHQDAITGLMKQLDEYKTEVAEINRLLNRYNADQPTLIPMAGAGSQNGVEALGPSDMLVKIVRLSPDGRIPSDLLVDRFEAEVKAEHVRTATTDARKLGSSIIPQLIRNGRLDRDSENPHMIMLGTLEK